MNKYYPNISWSNKEYERIDHILGAENDCMGLEECKSIYTIYNPHITQMIS